MQHANYSEQLVEVALPESKRNVVDPKSHDCCESALFETWSASNRNILFNNLWPASVRLFIYQNILFSNATLLSKKVLLHGQQKISNIRIIFVKFQRKVISKTRMHLTFQKLFDMKGWIFIANINLIYLHYNWYLCTDDFLTKATFKTLPIYKRGAL